MYAVMKLSENIMDKLMNVHKKIISGFNPPDSTQYPDVEIFIFIQSALFTKCV